MSSKPRTRREMKKTRRREPAGLFPYWRILLVTPRSRPCFRGSGMRGLPPQRRQRRPEQSSYWLSLLMPAPVSGGLTTQADSATQVPALPAVATVSAADVVEVIR